jgi:hypothetical protein
MMRMERSFSPRAPLLIARLLGLLVPLLFAAIVGAFFQGPHIWESLGTALISFALVACVAALYVWLHTRNTRITSAPQNLTIRNFLGATYSVAPRHLARILFIGSIKPMRGGNKGDLGARTLVLDETGRAVLRWHQSRWEVGQMEALIASLQLPVDTIDGPISLKDIHARYPRALRFGEAHPYIAVALIVGIFVAFCVAMVAVVFATTPA